ncbi:hypothetical protein JVT61DRAFT_15124 [Boletus reticuloceps]|uniref:Uncharacterized protein n=1 Tax=Boletus reticuloceps TaxID=495285 RepID=A0A8I3A9X4_9AGAM|nr:hypothetical protein JVT61DRAFT_15124 [Boletus reticuloceps]
MSPCRNLLSSFAILATALFIVAPVGIVAQSSDATCLPSYDWMANSKDQSPCLVAAYLMSVCDGTGFVVQPIPPTDYYSGTYASGQRACACSTVTYSAFSACAICQNAMEINWSQWSFNCSSTYLGSYAPSVPSGTAVPQWMFQDVTITNMFNATHASFIGDLPESTGSVSNPATAAGTAFTTEPIGTGAGTSASLTAEPIATSTQTSPQMSTQNSAQASTQTSPQTSNQTSTQTSTSAPSGGGSKTGAIVGGVVGGVVELLAIVGLAAFFLVKKPSQPEAPMAQHIPSDPSAIYTDGTPFGLSDIVKP